MLCGRIAFGDRDEARQPRLRRQKIVRRWIEPVRALVESDRKQLPLLVKQKREVHRERYLLRERRDGLEALHIARRVLPRVVLAFCDFAAGRGGRDEMASKIARIHG